MKFTVATVFTTFACSALAVDPPAGHEYIKPGPDDSRSPCPGLNSLANHGFLPRDGKAVTLTDFIKGGKEGLNMGIDFMSSVALFGFQAAGPTATSIDLDQLQAHNFPIEHDASLSRQDTHFGQALTLHKKEFRMWWDHFDNVTAIDIPTASAAKYARVADSIKRNPDVLYGPRQLILSYGETALYLQTMGRSRTKGVALKSYVHSLFKHEQLPYDLGWTPPPHPITLDSLGAMTVRLQQSSPGSTDEAVYVLTDGALADLIKNGIIANETGQRI